MDRQDYKSNALSFVRSATTDRSTQGTQLLTQAGFIQQVAAGIFTWLPLGIKVLNKISARIKRTLNAYGGFQEVLFPTMQPGNLWKESGRLQNAYSEEKLVIKDKGGRVLVYGPTAEEMSVELFRRYFQSYKQLPLVLYNIQWKFRDELRPRFGIMRSREFLMLDAYSFHDSSQQGREVYKYVCDVYKKVLRGLGMEVLAARADVGEIGGDMSHELVVQSALGEATIDFDDNGNAFMVEGEAKSARAKSAIELGHCFYLGDHYSKKMQVKIDTQKDASNVHMGCYGIGVSRVMGLLAEQSAASGKLVWPAGIAPYDISIVTIGDDEYAETVRSCLNEFDVMIDNRDESLKLKLADAELVGIPYRIVVGAEEKQGQYVTLKYSERQSEQVSLANLVTRIRALIGEAT